MLEWFRWAFSSFTVWLGLTVWLMLILAILEGIIEYTRRTITGR